MDMQLRVAAALMQWRLIERALHEKDGWTMEAAGVRVPAEVVVLDSEVRFSAEFPSVCFLDDAPSLVALYCGDDLLRVIDTDVFEIGGNIVEWTMSMVPVPA